MSDFNEIVELFSIIDFDKNGYIDSEELLYIVKQSVPDRDAALKQVEELFLIDINHNNNLDFKEFSILGFKMYDKMLSKFEM